MGNAPLPALADWQGEPQRQLQKFELFSGAYRNDGKKRATIEDITDKIIEAVQDGRADTVKTEYSKLLEFTGLKGKLKGAPVPKGARIIDLGSSGSGTAKFAVDEFA